MRECCEKWKGARRVVILYGVSHHINDGSDSIKFCPECGERLEEKQEKPLKFKTYAEGLARKRKEVELEMQMKNDDMLKPKSEWRCECDKPQTRMGIHCFKCHKPIKPKSEYEDKMKAGLANSIKSEWCQCRPDTYPYKVVKYNGEVTCATCEKKVKPKKIDKLKIQGCREVQDKLNEIIDWLMVKFY